MEPFVRLTGATAPLDRANVDTDQIIPKQFLKRIERTGFGEYLFFDWRNDDPDFVLARPRFRHASILVAGANFGSGSSREHAPWALQDWGYRAIIAPSYADIFRSNCAKVGLLCVALPAAEVAELLAAAPAEATVDLERQVVTLPSGRVVSARVSTARSGRGSGFPSWSVVGPMPRPFRSMYSSCRCLRPPPASSGPSLSTAP